MPLVRITNGFDRLSDDNLLARTQFIYAQMLGNVNFLTPDPPLTSVLVAINDFKDALMEARTGNKQSIAVKNEKKEALIDIMHKLGNYVLFIAKENAVIATSSGFHIARNPTPLPTITAPQEFEVSNGSGSGQLALSARRVPGARAYLFEYTPEPMTAESVWTSQVGTRPGIVFSNLQSGNRYWCRVGAVGINSQLEYTDPVARIVQ